MAADKQPRYFRFLRGEVLPRGKKVLLHRNVVVAIIVAIASASLSMVLPGSTTFPNATFTTYCTATVTYAALSFGGAMTCAILAVSLPVDRLLMTMVVNSTGNGGPYIPTQDGVVAKGTGDRALPGHFGKDFRSWYADLVFTYLWTAVAQLILAVSSMICLALMGDTPLAPEHFHVGTSLALLVMAGTTTFAVLQLASCLKTLMQFARRRDDFIRSDLVAGGHTNSEG